MYIDYELNVFLPIYKMPCFRGLDFEKKLHYMLLTNFQARFRSVLCIDRLPKWRIRVWDLDICLF